MEVNIILGVLAGISAAMVCLGFYRNHLREKSEAKAVRDAAGAFPGGSKYGRFTIVRHEWNHHFDSPGVLMQSSAEKEREIWVPVDAMTSFIAEHGDS